MADRTARVIEWKIKNISHWCEEVHGLRIKSPKLHPVFSQTYGPYIELYRLYRKGIDEQGDLLLAVRFSEDVGHTSSSGELYFYSSKGVLLSKQPVERIGCDYNKLTYGPNFEDVLSSIRDSEDFITVKLRIWDRSHHHDIYLCTTINVLKISLEINPRWIEEIESDETKEVFCIQLSPNDGLERMGLEVCFENNAVKFTIRPPTDCDDPFAVCMSMRMTESDGTVDSGVQKEHVFLDNSPWTFPDSETEDGEDESEDGEDESEDGEDESEDGEDESEDGEDESKDGEELKMNPKIEKKELVKGKISLVLFLKTFNLIQSPLYVNFPDSCVSIESKHKICFPEKASTTDTVASNKVEVLTKDSGRHNTTLPSDMPDDSVRALAKELMYLYQDQDFSDITLKCYNVTFPVHRAILSARSPVFKSMLSSDMQETASSEVDIEDLDPSTLSIFLTYLYTGAVEEELQCDRALKLYYTADKYQVPFLKRECSEFLRSVVSISNVCDILSLADRHQDDELTAASHDFILDNYNDVLKSKEWNSFMGRESLLAVKTLTHFAMKDSVRKHDSK